MDYISHGIWSYILFNKIKKPLLAVAFGLLPDTFSWFIYMVYRLIHGTGFGRPVLSEIPEWTFTLYNITHSLFVAAAFILLLWLILRKFPVYALAWPIAIVMDLFTHKREFLPTPFLWPFSNWYFPGISWGTKWFMIANYLVMLLALLGIYVKSANRNL